MQKQKKSIVKSKVLSPQPVKQGLLRHLQWSLLVVSAFLVALLCAWQVLASANFLYPLWYELIGIEHNIATYGPQNRNRDDFQLTDKAERIRLFEQIVQAVHSHGRGLEDLVYHDPAGRPIDRLLTAPEIVHLQDVARLVDRLLPLGWLALLALLALAGALYARRALMPDMRLLLLTPLLVLAGGGLLIGLLGPVDVFYRLHVWVFPAEHQWFFYYQDSLMTTLLKAPDIFAGIAMVLALLSLLFWVLLLLLARRLFQRFSMATGATGSAASKPNKRE